MTEAIRGHQRSSEVIRALTLPFPTAHPSGASTSSATIIARMVTQSRRSPAGGVATCGEVEWGVVVSTCMRRGTLPLPVESPP